MEDARKGFDRLRNACLSIEESLGRLGSKPGVSTPAGQKLTQAAAAAKDKLIAAMDDDFNSAGAIGQIFELVKTYHVLLDENGPAISNDRTSLESVKTAIEKFDSILGLFREGFPKPQDTIPEEIKLLADARQKARKNKDFQRADELREQIAGAGYTVDDTPEGVRIRKK
jgi:cysteinyl-tRNA synthetase